MEEKRRFWWNPESSGAGTALMIAVLFGTLFVAYRFFNLSDFAAFVSVTVATMLTGIAFNAAAHHRGWKKIHWLDIVYIGLWWQ